MSLDSLFQSFMSRSPRFKTAVVVGVFLLVAGVFAYVFYLGTNYGDGWAESRYTKERDARLKQIAQFEKNAEQFAAENSLLKKQNEAYAAVLKQADTKREQEAAKVFADLMTERTKQYEEIDLNADYDSQLCFVCAEGERSGFAPFSFCGRCKNNP